MRKVYQCTVCGRCYHHKEQAESCEADHSRKFSISGTRNFTGDHGWPSEIIVESPDPLKFGTLQARYKLIEEQDPECLRV